MSLIRTKIFVQAIVSFAMLDFSSEGVLMATKDYILDQLFSLTNTNDKDNILIGSAVLWSRSAINAVAPFLQVGAQQTVRASRAYVLYASQPLCVSILRFVLLKETTSNQVLMSASMFLITIFFAATANSRFQL